MGSASAPPNSASTPVTISAIPVAGAGPAEKTISVLVNVRANFEVLAALDAANKPAEIVGCADYTMGLRIIRDFGFKGVVTLEAVNLPAGVHANFKRSQIDFSTSGNAQEETEVTFSVDPGVSFPLASAGANPPQIVGKSAGAPASILPVALSASLTKINGFSPAQGWTPREFKPGDEVTISGQGFCGDAFVAFGNGYSKAHPTWVSDDATQMELRVHRLATTGPLALSMEEDPASTPMVTSAAPFTVFSYRNRSGYSFRNPHNIDVSFSDVDELFGYEQTHLSIDFCWPFGCSVATPIPSPLAAIFTGIARGALNDGQCFGMGLSSQRILHGQKPISDFPPAGATSLYELIGPNAGALPSSGTIGQGEKLLHYVHVQHIAQLSSEYLHHWIGQAALNLSQPSGHIRLQVMDALSAGDHPLISLRHGGKGHVVVAYNLEDDGMGTGGFFIDVYDPNEPFVNGENAANGELHKDREGFLDPATSEEIGGRVHIFPNGTWRFPHSSKTNPWEGGLDTLVVARSSVVPLTPTMPASFDGLITLIFGEAAGTTQILDGSGRFALNSKGEINRDPASAISGAHRFAIAAAEDSDSDIYILPGSGTYVQSITGKAKGPYTAASISLKGSTRLTTDTRAGASDEVKRLPDVAGLDFRSAGAPRPYEAEVATMARDSSQRRIKLTSTTSKAGDSIAFDAAAEHIVYDHRGPPAAYTFALEWAGQSASPASFVSPSLRVRKGDHVTIAPSNWQDLSSQPVAVTVVSASGKSETVSLPIAPQISGITIKRVISDRKGFDRRIGLESEFASATAPTDLVYVSWNMLRNGKSIGRHVEQINQLIEAGGSRTDFWTAPSEIHGVVQIDASVTLIRQNEVLSSETARLSRQVKLD